MIVNHLAAMGYHIVSPGKYIIQSSGAIHVCHVHHLEDKGGLTEIYVPVYMICHLMHSFLPVTW